MGRRLMAVLAAVLGVWLVGAWFVVPSMIRRAYRGESVGPLNDLISGRDAHPVEWYLDAWRTLAVGLTLAGLALVGLLFALHRLDAVGRVRAWSDRFARRESALSGAPRHATPREVLLIFGWCGLATGLVEGAYLARKMIVGEWLAVSMATNAHSVWMAPLSYLLIFAALGAPFAAVTRMRPVSVKWVVFAATAVGFLSLFRATAGRLELYGAIPLAGGLALMCARLGAVYADGFVRFARRSVPVIGGLLVVAAATIAAVPALSERRALAALDEAEPDRPNVLLLILDTVRSKSMSVYGYERPTTPRLERLGERGVVFDRAVASAPWTLPTHATIFTGRHHHELSVNWRRPLDGTDPTLAEVLRENGYATGGFVGNFYYAGPQFGVDRGFIRYRHKPITAAGVFSSGWLGRELLLAYRSLTGNGQDLVRKTAAQVNAEFLEWQASLPAERPFFAFLNFFDAHSPYLPPEPYDRRFADRPRYWLSDEGAEYSPEDLQALTDAYDNSLAYLDERLGDLFDELDRRGVLENTLVVVTSDHGEQFGEHGLMYHSNSLYMPLLHVPLIVSYPSALPAGRRVSAPASVRDIAATVMDLTGLPDSPFPGSSLASLWSEGTPSEPDRLVVSEITRNSRIPSWMPAAYGPMSSLVSGRLHYVRRGDGAEELYDWFADPDETRDLAGDADRMSDLERFRSQLDSLRQGGPWSGVPSPAPGTSSR